jgi:membrane associated rhomboid family serine protease
MGGRASFWTLFWLFWNAALLAFNVWTGHAGFAAISGVCVGALAERLAEAQDRISAQIPRLLRHSP